MCQVVLARSSAGGGTGLGTEAAAHSSNMGARVGSGVRIVGAFVAIVAASYLSACIIESATGSRWCQCVSARLVGTHRV